MNKKVTGYLAIDAKERNAGLILCKYEDPTEPSQINISSEFAREVAKEDPSLIYALDVVSLISVVDEARTLLMEVEDDTIDPIDWRRRCDAWLLRV